MNSASRIKKKRQLPTAISVAVLFTSILLIAACGKGPGAKDGPLIGTFPMGERVQVGHLIYTVMEAKWQTQLSDDPKSRPPKNRYLVVKMNITNSGPDQTVIPPMVLINNSGVNSAEVSEGVDDEPRWFGGLLRSLKTMQTDPGVVIFDVPMSAYKLKVTDGEMENEKYALIDIPVHIE